MPGRGKRRKRTSPLGRRQELRRHLEPDPPPPLSAAVPTAATKVGGNVLVTFSINLTAAPVLDFSAWAADKNGIELIPTAAHVNLPKQVQVVVMDGPPTARPNRVSYSGSDLLDSLGLVVAPFVDFVLT